MTAVAKSSKRRRPPSKRAAVLPSAGKVEGLSMCVAAALLLALTVPVTLANLATTPTRANIDAADPLVRLTLAFGAGIWPITIAAVATAGYWLRGCTRLPRQLRAWRQSLAIAAAIGVTLPLLVRLIVGPSLPVFVPLEESAKPGMPFGLAAALIEEVLVRMLALPALVVLLRRRAAPALVVPAAILLSGLFFALAHELGPDSPVSHSAHFWVRFLLPGCAFSAAAIVFGVPVVLVAHLTAHMMIGLLFA